MGTAKPRLLGEVALPSLEPRFPKSQGVPLYTNYFLYLLFVFALNLIIWISCVCVCVCVFNGVHGFPVFSRRANFKVRNMSYSPGGTSGWTDEPLHRLASDRFPASQSLWMQQPGAKLSRLRRGSPRTSSLPWAPAVGCCGLPRRLWPPPILSAIPTSGGCCPHCF